VVHYHNGHQDHIRNGASLHSLNIRTPIAIVISSIILIKLRNYVVETKSLSVASNDDNMTWLGEVHSAFLPPL
jgi:hypothetical protein